MDAHVSEELKPFDPDAKAPAFMIGMSAQVGRDANMNIQFGLPADFTLNDMHAYVDKAFRVIERRNLLGLLEQARLVLESHEKQVLTTREQRAAYETKCALDFIATNRKGEFKPTGAQRSQLDNFANTERHLLGTVIPKAMADIAELERKIAAS